MQWENGEGRGGEQLLIVVFFDILMQVMRETVAM